jgi:hypothetical protein
VQLPPTATWQAAVIASAAARAPLAAFGALRKCPPQFPGVKLAGHFLKHADEQTVLALVALRRAVERFRLDTTEQTNWAILGVPRFMARMAGAHILTRFGEAGGPTVPPYALAQNSLHSISGAASIALGVRGPNVGIGGGPGALYEGLAAALTLYGAADCPGIWLLMTQWDPEPIPDGQGLATNEPICHAVALALRPGASGRSSLQMTIPRGSLAATNAGPEPTIADIAASIEQSHNGLPANWSCRLPWGAEVSLALAAQCQSPLAAA